MTANVSQSYSQPNTSTNNQSTNQFFFSPVVDYLLAGGFSILFYFFVYLSFPKGGAPTYLLYLSGLLLWVGNWPHFAATSMRLYGSRKTMSQYPLTATLAPIVVLAGMFASLFYPETIAPYFIKIFLIWSPYHFSGQTVGVTLIYARRAGLTFNKIERKALSFFVFGTYLYATMKAEVYIGTHTYFDIRYPTLGIPAWAPEIIAPFMWGGLIVLIWAFLRKSYAKNKMIPLIVLVPCLAQYFWFVQGSGLKGFYEFVPFFHSVQYLLVAAAMRVVEQSELKRQRMKVSMSMALWIAGIISLGIVFFWVFPRVLESFLGVPLYLALGVSGAAVQIHHFFVDGVIWKLKRETVSHPLMQNATTAFTSIPSGKVNTAN